MDLQPLNWPEAPAWSLATGKVGSAFILLGLLLFLISVFSWARSNRDPRLSRLGSLSFTAGACCLFGAMICLALLFANNRFEFEYVRARADAASEFRYKIAGIWSGQQGSFLLWGCTSALFGILAARATGMYRRWFTIVYAVFLAAICGILAYETPFSVLLSHGRALVPPNGAGLTPSLQNYWVVIHPPTIFTGFGSLTVLFAWAMSAMLTGDTKEWLRMVRPWALISLAVLGLGLCMGGFWAYETLGWGGFWKWDPVENVSFVPWLFVVALVHGAFIQTTKRGWGRVNLFLAGLPFISFVYGTFLTRSGFLSEASVHSFAEMNHNALWILIGFWIFSLAAFLGVWFWKGRNAEERNAEIVDEPTINRKNLYVLGAMLLSMTAVATAIGMSIPFFMALAGHKAKIVEEGLYHQVLVWFFVPIMLLVAIGPFVSWRKMGLSVLLNRLFGAFFITLGLVGFLQFFLKPIVEGIQADAAVKLAPGEPIPATVIEFPLHLHVPLLPWMNVLIFVCGFALVANIWRIGEMWRSSKTSLGAFISHAGLAVLMAGLIVSRGLERQDQGMVQEGSPTRILDYVVDYRGFTGDPLNRDNKLKFAISTFGDRGPDGTLAGVQSFEAKPGLYFLPGPQGQMRSMAWPHIQHYLSHDVYIALGEPVFEVWDKPLTLAPNETKTLNGVQVTYRGMQMTGPGGAPGTKFTAPLTFVLKDGETFSASPSLELTANGMEPRIAAVGGELLASLEGMDPATRSATIQLDFRHPIYPVDIFYKPLVGLVWAGAGILTFGGLLSAFHRRYRKPTKDALSASKAETSQDVETKEHASVPTA